MPNDKLVEALEHLGPGEFFVDGDNFDLIFRPRGGNYGGADKIVARMACGDTAYSLPSVVATLLNDAWNRRATLSRSDDGVAVWSNLLTKAVGDISAALILAGKQDKIQAWTAPYVEALNQFDAHPPAAVAGQGGNKALMDRAELAWQRFFYPANDCFDATPAAYKLPAVDLEVADCLRLCLAAMGRNVRSPDGGEVSIGAFSQPAADAVGTGDARYLSDRFQWAAPGDQQEDVWLLRFCDNDVRDAMWSGEDAEAEAWAAWNRHAPGYNCYLFRLAALTTPPRQPNDAVREAFLPMDAWDRRDETVLLLVDYTDGDHPLDDDTIAITIGHNNDHNVGEDEGNGWQFAGWCWTHDHYVQGKGKPIGWMPLPHHLAALASTKSPDAQAQGEG
jgi:hypothetical protein